MVVLLVIGLAFGFVVKSENKTGSIKGKVLENKTNEAIPFAKIQLIDKNENVVKVVSSDFDGKFTFDNINAGIYKLNVRHVEFQNSVLEKVKVEEDKITFVKFNMNYQTGVKLR